MKKAGRSLEELSGEDQSQSDARGTELSRSRNGGTPRRPSPRGATIPPSAGALVPLSPFWVGTADGDKGLTDASGLMTEPDPPWFLVSAKQDTPPRGPRGRRWIYKRRWCPPPEPIQIPHSHSTAFLPRTKTPLDDDSISTVNKTLPDPRQQHLGISNTTSLPPPTTTATPLPGRLTPRRTLRTRP